MQRPHIVQAVCQLDDNDSDIFRHRKQHFPNAFHLLFFLVQNHLLHLNQLCHTVYQLGNILSKQLANVIQCMSGIFYNIMQQSGTDTFGVHSQRYQNPGD